MFTKEIQQHVSFRLDTNRMSILPAYAEIAYVMPGGGHPHRDNLVIGQIQKAKFGICFVPYQENIAKLELALLLECYKV